ncbi:putative short-chain dehydrogenase/reductase family 16C member 6 [Tricladium varicosporioides]|nr:putative short-chain dehydrogenase/reductase family 16C member 6 [Hymenoscyphus varicosporioides]
MPSAKPLQSQLKVVALKSALIGLALSALPRVSSFLHEHNASIPLYLPVARRALKTIWAFTILYHLNKFLSHVSVNGHKTVVWDSQKELVIVTGGSSGIGSLTVRGFAEKGVKVFILDLNPPKESHGPNVFFHQTDVTSSASIAKAAHQIRSSHGNPTVLINNAGIGYGESILSESEAHIRTVINVNLLAHFLMVKEFLPAMIKMNHGHVVTVASIASYVTIAQNVDYSCTKAAVVAFHEGLRQELDYRYGAPMVRTRFVSIPLLSQTILHTH